MPLTIEDIGKVIKRYTDLWNSDTRKAPLWVSGALPGSSIPIPGINFGTTSQPKAGLSIPVHANLIVLNQDMLPESLLTTFLHEYGHTIYRDTQPVFDEIDSEVEAIRYSLATLENEDLADLAYREAAAVLSMATEDPYKTAVARLASDPLWIKYSRVR